MTQGSENSELNGQSGGCGSKAGGCQSSAGAVLAAKPVPEVDGGVKFTDEAVSAVLKILKEEGEDGDSLRVSVIGGGCAGYQYDLNFDKDERVGDVVLEYGEVKVFIDPISYGYLSGTTIDFVSGLNGTGFKFINPNAKRTCGCGSSWS